MTTIGAVGGAAFSHYIVFPSMIAFFGTFNAPDLAFMPRIEDAFDLYVKMLIGMSVVFQIPTVVFFLAKMRFVGVCLQCRRTAASRLPFRQPGIVECGSNCEVVAARPP